MTARGDHLFVQYARAGVCLPIPICEGASCVGDGREDVARSSPRLEDSTHSLYCPSLDTTIRLAESG